MELAVKVADLEGEVKLVKSKVHDFDKKIDKYDAKSSAFFDKLDIEREKNDKQTYLLESIEKDLEAYQNACEKKFQFVKDDFKEKLDALKKESEENDTDIRKKIEGHAKKLKEKEEKKSRTRLGFIIAWGGIIITWLLTFLAN